MVVAALLLATTACSNQQKPEDDGDFGSLGDDETSLYLQQEREELAEGYGIDDPPSVEVVRLIRPEEWQETLMSCMKEQGYDVTPTPDGDGVQYPDVSGEAQGRSLNIAIYTCDVKYPVSPKYTQPYNNGQLRFLYAFFIDDLVPCLKERGLTVEDVPSETAFLESEGAWSPYNALNLSDEDYKAANTACGNAPDSDELYAAR
ncbi:hypothetical protein [Microbacterium phyllosphaerae]|uniref:hypothetical protein n=1 Tax=Microbacterium phyllosphaerae TaxID=124798 RepID=UPI00142D5FFF|nr:hypothetical protein [Microbacterium phyllosphaerae]